MIITLWTRCVIVGIGEKVAEVRPRWWGHVIGQDEEETVGETMKDRDSRRCGVTNIAVKMMKARLRLYGHLFRRDEGEPGQDIMK
jgi:hypothetical protein